MKFIQSVALLVAVALLSSTAVRAQEMPKPGPEHAKLKEMAGAWTAVVKCTFEPGKPAQESKGESTGKLDVGGFFLITEFKATILGMPFHGRGITGYDPFKKKYVGTWIDSMSPGIFRSEGSFDKSGKILTEMMEGPNEKGKTMKMRIVTEMKDADHMLFQMYAQGENGKENLMMEIAYTRKK